MLPISQSVEDNQGEKWRVTLSLWELLGLLDFLAEGGEANASTIDFFFCSAALPVAVDDTTSTLVSVTAPALVSTVSGELEGVSVSTEEGIISLPYRGMHVYRIME